MDLYQKTVEDFETKTVEDSGMKIVGMRIVGLGMKTVGLGMKIEECFEMKAALLDS